MNIPQIERQIRRLDGGTEYLELLKGISPDKFISIDQIIQAVCKVYKTTFEAIQSKDRSPECVEPRRMLCFLNGYYGIMTLKELAKLIKKDHTSVIFHRDRVAELISVLDNKALDGFYKCKIIIEDETNTLSGRGTNETVCH